MSDAEERRTVEGFRRLITFADAVVAIALTLLVLPLADVANELTGDTSVGQVFSDHDYQILSFFISFAVIWALWKSHHRLMEYFRAYDGFLIHLHFVWLLTIVVLPFATSLLDSSNVQWANVLYIGVLAVSVSALMAIDWWGKRHHELLEPDSLTDAWINERIALGTLATLLVALVVAVAAPDLGSWPLLILVLARPLEKLLTCRRHADEDERSDTNRPD